MGREAVPSKNVAAQMRSSSSVSSTPGHWRSAPARLMAVLAIVSLAGCQQEKFPEVAGASATRIAPLAMMAAEAPAVVARTRQSDSLAYEHTVSIELTQDLLPARLREIEEACVADTASNCTILEVSLQTSQDLPSGNIRMRLAPGGVDPIVALASKDGKITGRTTRAEDLAQPIADTERELSLMSLHRDRLTELMKRKDIKIEQLIIVSRELATVQSQIDSLTTQRANLQRRVDTDLLTLNLALPVQEYAAEQSPVTDALKLFGSDFREAIGQVIRFVAVVIPWLVIVVPGIILLRIFWRWIGRWIGRREQRAKEA